jgi:hypothetical protein
VLSNINWVEALAQGTGRVSTAHQCLLKILIIPAAKGNSGPKNTEKFCFLAKAQALRPYLGVSSFLEIS